MKGQLSAEMLILITVVLAIVAIAATQLMKSAQGAGEQVEQQSNLLYERTSGAMKGADGEFCISNTDCQSDNCDTSNNECR
ncbi:class III signal peptide-containing protein [Candidatus Micrarchaeota archaeon]|nr:class III signal peptide-containing protein [Candidatus Micrarchaeota archaeon]